MEPDRWRCAGRAQNKTASALGAWSTSAPVPSRPTACATARGACRAGSSGSGCRAGQPGRVTRRAALPNGPRSAKGPGAKLAAIARAHPGARIQLRCEDEARIGQKGRTCRRWCQRGVRPPGLAGKGFESLYLFAACRPGTDEAPALALPRANAPAMSLFLERLAGRLAPGVHAALILDQAGWHGERALRARETITLLPLPAHSPEPSPVERAWLDRRERFLSHRVLDAAALDAACDALLAETGRLASLTAYPYVLRSELR